MYNPNSYLQEQITVENKLLMDGTIGGLFISKTAADVIKIIESMALNDHKAEYNRSNTQKKAGLIELDTKDAFLPQNKLLTQTVEELSKQISKLPQQLKSMQQKLKQVLKCELCLGDHQIGLCPFKEDINFVIDQWG